MRAKKLTLAALALTAGLSLTACQGGDNSASGANDSGSSSSSSSSSSDSAGKHHATNAGKDSVTTQSAEGSGGGQITAGTCKTADLDFGTAHGMGQGTLIVSFKNTGGDACSLKGFPGVDLRSQDASGPLSAERSDLAAPAVAIKPGESTRFTLHYPEKQDGEDGVYVSAIEVTPPNETHSKALSTDLSLPVGADGKVFVDPVGTGKQ
ncbi:DUF4232 domain-containing protein [Streptomyces tsukubensis]|uniref:DUF4232 domain-containing protein n=1 Tax=Streptomyces tsukubensis TaxID=83656 RepID=A0A1V4A7K3_9ACTN|nr:DUF4232 domain-containing protein [Streptomyces tsukubensis]OON78371.1 hypothetical protein B1H18_16390 [Streptomyces tsukubensis]QFR95133.1 DUF4232 domain-containing protein [Streptomyces tsukubensis]